MDEALVERYLRRELAPDEQRRLRDLLEGDADAARRFVELVQEHTLVADVARQFVTARAGAALASPPGGAEAPARRRAIPTRAWRIAALVAVAVGLAGVGALLVGRDRPLATLHDAVAASVIRAGADRGEAALFAGDRITTAADGHVELRYPDATVIRLGADGDVVVAERAGKHLDLRRGRVDAEVAPQPGDRPLRVQTAHATATVVGTRFTLTTAADATRLDVAEGEVVLARDDASVAVDAGAHAIAMPGQPLVARPTPPSPYGSWSNGPSSDPAWFPIGVWMQEPEDAARYRDAGITFYLNLWKGPTETQLADLARAGMPVICAQNAVGLRHLADRTIIGWSTFDLPELRVKGRSPEQVLARYRAITAADPTRPVLLNLGQGIAWDGWPDGDRDRYPAYARGCDIAAFDIYPVTHPHPDVAGKLELVARGVERLRAWHAPDKPVWHIVECAKVESAIEPTPAQVKAEVWMGLIRGSTGVVYFVHEWQPELDSRALLHDPLLLPAVAAINREIAGLAPVLNAPTVAPGASAIATGDVPIACLTKRQGGATHVFAVGLRDRAATATVTVPGIARGRVEVIGEDRAIALDAGRFVDDFAPYAVHLYRITSTPE